MKPKGVPRPVRLGEPYESVVCEKSVPSYNCHMRSPGCLCVLAILVQYTMNSYAYGFRKVPLRMQCGPVYMPYGLWITLRPVLQNSMGPVQGL